MQGRYLPLQKCPSVTFEHELQGMQTKLALLGRVSMAGSPSALPLSSMSSWLERHSASLFSPGLMVGQKLVTSARHSPAQVGSGHDDPLEECVVSPGYVR